jgi:elongation factor Ts
MSLKDDIKDRMTKSRPTRSFSYIHGQGRIGVLLEIESDTDFALRNELMEQFALEVCLQIAATDPVAVDTYDCEARALAANRIDDEVTVTNLEIRAKILEGKMDKWDKDNILLLQPWVKDTVQTIGDLLTALCEKMGEDVQIIQFARFGS